MNDDVPAWLVHNIDQQHPEAVEGLEEHLEEARELLERHGQAMAAALLGVSLLQTYGSAEVLAGLAGLALVELARRESDAAAET